jgi:hypothetical protein
VEGPSAIKIKDEYGKSCTLLSDYHIAGLSWPGTNISYSMHWPKAATARVHNGMAASQITGPSMGVL